MQLNLLINLQARARHWWFIPVIPATWEAEPSSIKVQSKPGQIVHKALSPKNPSQERAGEVARGVGPEFRPQYHKRNK
jgi:hypothetical protein